MAEFSLAIPIVLENEGGYVDDPNDPGGETNFGISKRSYPNVDIKGLTAATASAIYERDFWKFGGITDQGVANKLFDSYVNMEHTAIKIAQTIVAVTADGVYGPGTEAAINYVGPEAFLAQYRTQLEQHYRNIVRANPAEEEFLAGWLRRAAQ
jgi:lysozyme family protein